MNRKSRIQSFGRDSRQSRSSITGESASKLPRSTPLLHSTKKVLPSTSQKSSGRSSYFGTSDHHVMKDTRPLSDKPYMKKCVMDLLKFLSDMNYPYPLSAKMLMPPTNKEYFRIFEFVYSLLSPQYKMVARPDEEVAKILYDLSYPFSLSKSSLSNIGTMSAWPHALGALDWLVSLVKYTMALQCNEMSEMLCKGVKKQEVLSEYLKDTYTAFMHGRNQPYTDIDEKVERELDEMNRERQSEVEEAKIKQKKLKMRRDELLKEKEEMVENEQLLSSMQIDRKNFQDYFDQFEDYRESLQNKYKGLEARLAELERLAADMEMSNKEIQSTVSGQELSVSDVQKLQIEKGQMEESVVKMEERCKQLEKQYFEKQISRSKMIGKLGSQIAEYTQLCHDLQLIPETAANAKGDDFSLRTDHAEIDQNVEKLLSVIRPKLMNMKSEFLASHGKLQHERNCNATIIEQLKEQASDQERMVASLKQQFDKLKEEDDKQSSEFSGMEKKHSEDMDRVKEQIESLKTVNSVSIKDIDAQLKTERQKFNEAIMKSLKEKNDFSDLLLNMGEKCLDQKTKIEKMFQDFYNNIKATKQTYLPRLEKVEQGFRDLDSRFEQHGKELAALEKDLDHPANK